MKYTPEERAEIAEAVKVKTIERMEWDEIGQYWAMTFTDESSLCFRLMAELFDSRAAETDT